MPELPTWLKGPSEDELTFATELVKDINSFPQEVQEKIFTNLMIAVAQAHLTLDIQRIVRFVDGLKVSAHLYKDPAYREAMANAPDVPDLNGPTLKEVIERLREGM